MTPEPVQIGNATLYCGDCAVIMQKIAVMGLRLVMDPPYVFRAAGGGKFRKDRPMHDAILDEELDKGFDHSIINPLLFDSVTVFCHNDQLAELLTYLKGSYDRQVLLMWHKSNPMPVANKNYQPDTEFFIHAWNMGSHPAGNLADKGRYFTCSNGRDKSLDHPTVKPLDLMRKIITNTAPGIIIDPFMGTGSTGVAAIEQGREFIGIEKNPKHMNTAIKRIAECQDLPAPEAIAA